jgi:hypothetical protein
MVDSKTNLEPKKLLGAGRSGQVFLISSPSGKIARKIFSGDTLAKIVHYVFFGADNAYIWNEDFLKCAYYRRKILDILAQYWFGSKLKIASAINTGWHEELKLNILDTEFIAGRNVSLRHPVNKVGAKELDELVHQIMKPLQKRLIESGFDGLVWQAGKGNPVALNNFLIDDASTDNLTFVWIDMESGVPALFPLNILTLFTFYLSKSFKHKIALFDDVDINKLKNYTNIHQTDLEQELGSEKYWQLLEFINNLEKHQKKWRALTRLKRAIFSQLKQGKINQTQAEQYLKNPLLWYLKEFKKLVVKSCQKLFIDFPVKVFNKLRNIDYLGLIKKFWKLLFSRRYRLKIAKDHVVARIKAWQDRKQLTSEEAEDLFNRLEKESGSDYLSDFGVHIGMKVFVKFTEYGIFPFIFAAGLIDEITFGFILLMGGPISRTIYTSYRMFQASVEGKEIPWVAFFFGLFPMLIGNIAYPIQMIYSASGNRGKVAKFIVYDTFTQIGEKIPIWGGEDTLTEHFFNHSAERVVNWIGFWKKQTQS